MKEGREKGRVKVKMAVAPKVVKGMGKKRKEQVIQQMLKQDMSRFDDEEGKEKEGEEEGQEEREEKGEVVRKKREVNMEDKESKPTHAALADAIMSILSTKLPEEVEEPVLAKRKLKHLVEEDSHDSRIRELKRARIEKKLSKEKGRVIPTMETANYEKELKKLATRGVVTLFNAIAKHQKTIDDSNEQTKKISKANFLEMLKKGKGGASTDQASSDKAPGWSALDENMLLKTKKMKDFDRKVEGDDTDEEEEEEEMEEEMEEEDD